MRRRLAVKMTVPVFGGGLRSWKKVKVLSMLLILCALTPNMPTETQHRIPQQADFWTPGRWKMEHHLTPSYGATGRASSKIDSFGHLAFLAFIIIII